MAADATESSIKCQDVEAVYRCIADHEERYRVKFITAHKDRDFGKIHESIPDPGKSFLRFRLDYGGQSPKIECDGVPFFYMHRHVLICHQGRDRNEKTKARRKALVQFSNATNQEHTQRKKRKLVQDTKKVDCPASVYVVQILRFIDYKLQYQGLEPTGHSKVLAKRQLKERYQTDSSSIRTETLFYVSLPPLSSHRGHPVNNIAAGLREALDPQILHKISELTAKGIYKVPEIRKHLDEYVQSALFHSSEQPERTRRRYYPTDIDIRNAVQRAKKEVHTKVDQNNASMLISLWKQESQDFFEYRPLKQGSEVDKFLFCCQTRWQSRLLNRYGNSFTVLDAVYRSAGYSLPLFLLSVRTNMGYTPVGMFVSHSDTAEDIAEALSVFRRWNPDWNPEGFMVDYFDPEIEATETVFPGCTALFCYHRCETLWQDWLRDSSGMSDGLVRARMIKTLRRIAMATTMREQECGLKGLKTMNVWKENEAVSTWFSMFWLSCMKRWTTLFQNERVRVAMYAVNGCKQQNDMFNHPYVSGNKDCSLSEMMTILYTKCFPGEYRKYVEFNARYSSSYLKYSSDIPAFLHSKPRFIVEHVEKCMTTTVIPENIQAVQDGHFVVKGDRNQAHQVFFGNEERYPSCTCSYWTKLYLPCKHFCAIFRHVPGWSWDQLGAAYRDNPLFLLDGDVLMVSDPKKLSQEVQKLATEERKPAEPGGSIEESTIMASAEEVSNAQAEEASKSKRPQRAAVTCKRLVRKNMDLLDKLESQVPHLKDKIVLEDMLNTLQKLVHRVQRIGTRGKKNTVAAHRISLKTQKRKLQSDFDWMTEKNQSTVSSSEHAKAPSAVEDDGSSMAAQLCPNVFTCVNSDIHQAAAGGSQEISGTSQQSASSAAFSHDNENRNIQNTTLDNSNEISSDMIEAIVLNQNLFTGNYLPLTVDAQGSEGTVAEHHNLHGNITIVTEAPVGQEVMSTEGVIIQTVDQIDHEHFIIDSVHQGITVTVADAELDRVPSVT
nr:uncharacterized protein LOC129264676 [Lytechinus pictus]